MCLSLGAPAVAEKKKKNKSPLELSIYVSNTNKMSESVTEALSARKMFFF